MTDTEIALAALIVSFVSLVFSSAISIWTICQTRKINTTNLEAKHFEKIFTEYIVIKIPNAVEQVEFENNKLSAAYRELISIMMDMIDDAKYYAYAKKEFYQQLRDRTMGLEDRLIAQANKIEKDEENQVKFIYGIHEEVSGIIKLINKNYHDF